MSTSSDELQAGSGPADLLLLNARVLTMDWAGPTAQAVAVRGAVIETVSSDAEVSGLAGPQTRIFDCAGQTLLPGFIDAHCHIAAMATSLLGVDCGPRSVSSIEQLIAKLELKADAIRRDGWVRGHGYDDLALQEQRHPTRWDLDRVSADKPVRLDHRSGHATVLNSRGMALAGIHRETPDPVDGVIERDKSTGEPTGLFLETSGFLRQRLGHRANLREFQSAAAGLSEQLLGYGITSVTDAGPGNDLAKWKLIKELLDSKQFGCRVTMMAGSGHLGEFQRAGLGWGDGNHRLRLGHAKIMLTLTTGGLQPSIEELVERVSEAHRLGFPAAIHAVETEAIAAAAQALEAAPPLEMPPGSIRPTAGFQQQRLDRIEHCSECPPALVSAVFRSGATVVTQPGFIYWNGAGYRERVTGALLPHIYPIGSLARAGVPVAFGSDGPVVDPNPWPAIYSAVTGNAADCEPLVRRPMDCGSPEQMVDVLSALEMHTLAGARDESAPPRKGSIGPGKLADMVLIDADPTSIETVRLKDISAVMTMVGGKIVWER